MMRQIKKMWRTILTSVILLSVGCSNNAINTLANEEDIEITSSVPITIKINSAQRMNNIDVTESAIVKAVFTLVNPEGTSESLQWLQGSSEILSFTANSLGSYSLSVVETDENGVANPTKSTKFTVKPGYNYTINLTLGGLITVNSIENSTTGDTDNVTEYWYSHFYSYVYSSNDTMNPIVDTNNSDSSIIDIHFPSTNTDGSTYSGFGLTCAGNNTLEGAKAFKIKHKCTSPILFQLTYNSDGHIYTKQCLISTPLTEWSEQTISIEDFKLPASALQDFILDLSTANIYFMPFINDTPGNLSIADFEVIY